MNKREERSIERKEKKMEEKQRGRKDKTNEGGRKEAEINGGFICK